MVGSFWGGSAVNLLQRRLDAASTGLAERVVRGLACLEFFDTITAEYDANALAKRDFRRIIPEIRRRAKGRSAEAKGAGQDEPSRTASPGFARSHRSLSAVGKMSGKGFSLKVEGWTGDPARLERRVTALLEALSKNDG